MIVKKEEMRPLRPVITLLYGVPGVGKTSVATTAEDPIIIDTDRGSDRAVSITTTSLVSSWRDVITDLPEIKKHKTVIVDTAKACLDDFLRYYVEEKNYKLKTNAMKRFGEMGDEFKAFVEQLRTGGSDIIFICHDKAEQEGDVFKHSPDCTGQSKNLLLRISDQVGFIAYSNGQRQITFAPRDNFDTKDTAQLGVVDIPDATSPEWDGFMGRIIEQTKHHIQEKGEAQKKALDALSAAYAKVAEVSTLEQANAVLKLTKTLEKPLQKPFFEEARTQLEKKGFVFDMNSKSFKKDGKAAG